MSEFPSHWDFKCIGDFASRVRRKNAGGECQDPMTISAVDGLVSQRDYFNKIVASKNTENYTLLHKNDFAYNKSYSEGYPVGAARRLKTKDKGIVSPLYICFELDRKQIDLQFADYLFDSDWFVHAIFGIAKEGARSHGLLNIGIDEFFSAFLPIPPLPEQKKVAEILCGIDRLVDAKERRVKQRKLLLKSAFEDATNKSASDDFVPLSDLGRWRGGGTPSKSIPEYWGGTIPWVSPKDMKGRKISCSQDAITQEAVENSTTSLIPKDSILFVVRSGVLRHTFPIALATREVAINQDLKALTVSDHCNANFLLHYLCCRSEEILASCMKSGTTVESIDTNSLQNYQVPAISIREQLRLSLFAESIATAIEVEQSQVESLKMLKSSLSSDLLSGRKRVSV